MLKNNKIQKLSHQNRLMSLDYLKAISIVLVIITHSFSAEQLIKLGAPFFIYMAVPCFMIISGFTYSMSANKHNINTLQQWFCWKSLSPKLLRIVPAYTIIICLETIYFLMHETKSIKELLIVYFSGGWGPGSYYFPLLIQLLIIFPLLFILFKKFPIITILLAFGIHLGFDVIRYTLPIPDWSYRLLIFRYFAFIVLGILLYHYKNIMQKKYLLIFLTMLSGIYIWICYYYGYIPVIFSRWTHSSLPTVFWAFGLVVLGFNYLEIKNVIYISKVFSMIGKASYHIFLVQMAYFTFGLGALGLVSNILICIITGIMFYYFETLILNSRHSGFKSFVPPTIQQ